MSPIVVVFLMDFIPDFEVALNNNLKDIKNEFTISTCESSLTDLIWNQINERLHGKNTLIFDNDKVEGYLNKHINEEIEGTNLKTLNKSTLNVYLPDTSDTDDSSNEEFKLFQDNYLANKLNSLNYYDAEPSQARKFDKNDRHFLERPPFLVAIFETFENVTAQTCSGTLLSSHWVLTLPSCIEVVSHMQENVTRHKNSETIYTIIANAGNPLLDGTVHNVTKIMFSSSKFYGNLNTTKMMKLRAGIVIMRIEPPVHVQSLNIIKEEMKSNASVTVFGWEVVKGLNGSAMKAASFEANILQHNQCKIELIKYLKCLSAKNYSEARIKLINSGGPVLTIQENNIQLLGVAQIETNLPVIAYPIAPYLIWIHDTIKNN